MHTDANSPDKERSPKLGDEWRDWDGQSTPDATAPKRLFFALVLGVLVVMALSSVLSWYMVAPRLAEWHPRAPAALLVVLGLAVVASGLAVGLLALMLLAEWPRGALATSFGRGILALFERHAFWLGRALSINRDRLAHAFIRTNNGLVRLAPSETSPDRVLLLLPRCLRKDQIDQARALARLRGIDTAIVSGGEQARASIREKRPSLVVGVACERDLLSGIRDIHRGLLVLGIANTRPDGPCRNTQIDLAELEAALDMCKCESASRKSATAEA